MVPRKDYMQQSFFHFDTSLFHHFCDCFVQYWFLDRQFYNRLSIWSASIVIGLHWIYLTRPKSMNKKINTNPHCFLSVIGPGGCGKTRLISRVLLNQKIVSKPCFEKILYFYKRFQTDYESLLLRCTRSKISIEFHQGLQWTAVDKSEAEKLKTLIVIDDLYQDACEDEIFLNLLGGCLLLEGIGTYI